MDGGTISQWRKEPPAEPGLRWAATGLGRGERAEQEEIMEQQQQAAKEHGQVGCPLETHSSECGASCREAARVNHMQGNGGRRTREEAGGASDNT